MSNVDIEDKYITFQDPIVFSILMDHGISSDGIGITKEDAAAVTTIEDWFANRTDIYIFRELKWFTSLSIIGGVNAQENAAQMGFYGCTNLSAVTLPDTLKIIGINAFRNCYSLTECNIPRNIERIYPRAFSYVPAAIVLDAPSLIELGYSSGDNVVFNNSGLQEIRNLSKISEIYNGILWQDSQIGVFSGCNGLIKADLSGVKKIGNYAMRDCSNLSELILSASNIGTTSFARCGALDKVLFTQEIEYLGEYSFAFCGEMNGDLALPMAGGSTIPVGAIHKTKVKRIVDMGGARTIADGLWNSTINYVGGCSGNELLELVIFPKSMETIGAYALVCYGGVLSTIVCKAVTPPVLMTAGLGGSTTRSTLTYIYVPDQSVDLYKSASGWSEYASLIRGISSFSNEQPEIYTEIEIYLNYEV